KVEEVGKELIVNLEGPSGKDFDLYLRYGLKPNWTEWDDKGYTSTPDETVRAYPTKTGNYYLMVHAHSGSGDYTLKASH
ncbi:MAG: PPC domain-containing protein, partial [Proteobacteria bacterium]|nr:PPC domain-containing protein [Pseudomonadota bacterium]